MAILLYGNYDNHLSLVLEPFLFDISQRTSGRQPGGRLNERLSLLGLCRPRNSPRTTEMIRAIEQALAVLDTLSDAFVTGVTYPPTYYVSR